MSPKLRARKALRRDFHSTFVEELLAEKQPRLYYNCAFSCNYKSCHRKRQIIDNINLTDVLIGSHAQIR